MNERFGLCLGENWKWVNETDISLVQNGLARFKLTERDKLVTMLEALPANTGVVLLIDGGSEGGLKQFAANVKYACQNSVGNRIKYIVPINEADTFADITPAKAAYYYANAYGIAQNEGSDIRIALPSVVSEHWPEYLLAMVNNVRSLGCPISCATVHPYGSDPPNITIYNRSMLTILQQASVLVNAPVLIDEFGINLTDTDARTQAIALAECAHMTQNFPDLIAGFCWFGYTQDIGHGDEKHNSRHFGMVTDDGERLPSYYAMRKLRGLELPKMGGNFEVGSGILAMMQEDGTQPVSSEVYINQYWSEAIGKNGVIYRWYKFNDDKPGHRYFPMTR